jgi:Nucleotidyltransferase domain
VRRAAVFGSVARGNNGADSDIDILVEIDPDAHLTVYDYAGLKSISPACSKVRSTLLTATVSSFTFARRRPTPSPPSRANTALRDLSSISTATRKDGDARSLNMRLR